jgi:hypothetical protein
MVSRRDANSVPYRAIRIVSRNPCATPSFSAMPALARVLVDAEIDCHVVAYGIVAIERRNL